MNENQVNIYCHKRKISFIFIFILKNATITSNFGTGIYVDCIELVIITEV